MPPNQGKPHLLYDKANGSYEYTDPATERERAYEGFAKEILGLLENVLNSLSSTPTNDTLIDDAKAKVEEAYERHLKAYGERDRQEPAVREDGLLRWLRREKQGPRDA